MSSAHGSANPHGIPSGQPAKSFGEAFARHFAVYGYTRRAIELVWNTNYRLAIILGLADPGGRPVAGRDGVGRQVDR